MIIVIEGPDGAGKTTLANRLSVEFGYVRVHHSGRPCTKGQLEHNCQHNAALAGSTLLTIIDRTPWVSELVYNEALGRPDRISKHTLESYHRLPQVVVYCHLGAKGDYKVLEGKAHKPIDYLNEVLEKHTSIVDGYARFFATPKTFPVVEYNRHIHNLDDIVQQLGVYL